MRRGGDRRDETQIEKPEERVVEDGDTTATPWCGEFAFSASSSTHDLNNSSSSGAALLRQQCNCFLLIIGFLLSPAPPSVTTPIMKRRAPQADAGLREPNSQVTTTRGSADGARGQPAASSSARSHRLTCYDAGGHPLRISGPSLLKDSASGAMPPPPEGRLGVTIRPAAADRDVASSRCCTDSWRRKVDSSSSRCARDCSALGFVVVACCASSEHA